MKKISILIALLAISIGISFGSIIPQEKQKTNKTEKTAAKKEDKKEVKKVPVKKKPDNTKDQKAAK